MAAAGNKYERLLGELQAKGSGQMKAFGQSMVPLLESGSLLTFERRDSYQVGDIVFSRVRGRYIDAHKITKADPQRGFLISNNKGRENGWTRQVFGKVVRAAFPGGEIRIF